MNTIKASIESIFQQAYEACFEGVEVQAQITQSTSAKFGHYQCNSSMKLTKALGMPPREISAKVVEFLNKSEDAAMLEKVDIAGPGFINVWLKASYLESVLNVMDEQDGFGLKAQVPERIVIDFSSPNIAKEMHVGHLRSTIIGDSLARVFEFLGHDVLRLNHLGDWGTAFGMLIAYIKEEVGDLDESKTDLTSLVSWYKASKKRFDEDEAFKKQSQLEVVALQSGDETNLKLWTMICSISERAYNEIYGLLDVSIEPRGESFYNDMLHQTVQKLEAKNLIETSDGAKCVYVDGFTNRDGEPLPLMVQKSDGGFNYASTDLAAVHHRVETEKASRIIYVTDLGQKSHFDMLFDVAKRADFFDDMVRCDHVGFGVVLGPDGKKFKTRSGETEKLIDLLNNAVVKAKTILVERQQEEADPMDEAQIAHVAKVLGIGAVKYADLSCNRTNDYVFSYDKMLKFEGNTAAFLLYSYVRICGIKRKIGEQIDVSNIDFELLEDAEKDLGLHLAQFSETLQSIAQDLYPNRLCEYLYTLAERFNAFFRDCRVQGSDKQSQRVRLCELTAKVMSQGLDLLGLHTIERM